MSHMRRRSKVRLLMTVALLALLLAVRAAALLDVAQPRSASGSTSEAPANITVIIPAAPPSAPQRRAIDHVVRGIGPVANDPFEPASDSTPVLVHPGDRSSPALGDAAPHADPADVHMRLTAVMAGPQGPMAVIEGVARRAGERVIDGWVPEDVDVRRVAAMLRSASGEVLELILSGGDDSER
jgi:ethanolamine utilization microcompartment shell protein EutL